MDATQIFTPLLANGPLGLLCAVLLYALWRATNELKACNEARIAESRESSARILEVVDKVYKATDQLANTADKLVELKRGTT